MLYMPSFRSLVMLLLALQTLAGAQLSDAPSKQTPQRPQEESAAPDYSQEAFVVEKLAREMRFENDGTGTSTMTARVRVQTQAGVQQLGQLVFGYNSANEKLDIVYVRVSKPDGTGTVTASEANFQDVPSQVERNAPMYSDYRERHITVPALRAGEILEYQIRTHTFAPLIPKHFWFEHVFRKDMITLDEQVIIDIPKNRKIKFKTKPEFTPKTETKGDRQIHRWASNYLKRESDEELKKKRRKEAREEWTPDVQLSSFESWQQLGDWYSGLQSSQMELTPELKAKVEELVKDARTDEDKVRALYDFVAQDFRYVSLSFGVGRFQPHAARDVFANKYGDCKDKHTLFSTMLKAIGLEVQPVLIGSQRKIDADIPSPSQFDHVFSAVMSPKGKDPMFWLDTTPEVAPFGLLSYNLRKKQALLVGMGEGSRLVETPPNPPFQSVQEFSIEGSVSDLGKLNAKVKGIFRGDHELAMRSVFRSVAENKWKDIAKHIAYQSGLGSEVDNVRISNLADTRVPFQVEFEVSKPNFLDWSNKSSDLVLPIPTMPLAPAARYFDEEGNEDPDQPDEGVAKKDPSKPDKPIELGAPSDMRMRVKLQLPAAHKARTPVPLGVKRDYVDYRSMYKVEGQILTADRSMVLRQREIPAERRADYEAFVRAVRNDERQKFHIESSLAATGAPELPKDIKTEELIDSARDAMQSQNYRVALDLLKLAAQKEPKHKYVWNMLGEAHIGQRQFAEAEQAFRKAIANDAFDQYAHNNLGRALFMQRKLDESVAAFQKQLEVDPLNKESYALLGELYLELDRYQDAAEVMEKCVSLEPDNAFYHANLGRAYLKLKRNQEAGEAFDKAVELQQNPMLWNNIAYELADSNSNLDRAEQYAESAVNHVESSLRNVSLERATIRDLGSVMSLGSFWDTLGWVAFKKGDLKKAERYIEASWKLTQGGEVGDHLAQIYQKQGRTEDAVKLYAQAVNGNRPKRDTRNRLSNLLKDEKKIDQLVAQQKAELGRQRRFSVGPIRTKDPAAAADFLVLLAPGGRIESAKFISGAEDLKQASAVLQRLQFVGHFPGPAPTRIIRRGKLSCERDRDCTFELLNAEEVTAVN